MIAGGRPKIESGGPTTFSYPPFLIPSHSPSHPLRHLLLNLPTHIPSHKHTLSYNLASIFSHTLTHLLPLPGWPSAFRQLLSQCWHQDSQQRPSFKEISERFDKMLVAAHAEAAKGTTQSTITKTAQTARSTLSSLFGVANR